MDKFLIMNHKVTRCVGFSKIMKNIFHLRICNGISLPILKTLQNFDELSSSLEGVFFLFPLKCFLTIRSHQLIHHFLFICSNIINCTKSVFFFFFKPNSLSTITCRNSQTIITATLIQNSFCKLHGKFILFLSKAYNRKKLIKESITYPFAYKMC